MPCICLGEQKDSYIRGCAVVHVKEGEYGKCSLFKKYTHTLSPTRRGCIYVFKGSKTSRVCLTLRNTGEYLCACLECVDVYYNQYDPAKRPLVLVFKFKNGDNRTNGVKNRYYRMSCFDSDKGKTKRIDQLCPYSSESDILCPLLQENDILANVLTYDIMRTTTNTSTGGGNGTDCKYNCGKITVKDDSNTSTNSNGNANGPTLKDTGFKRYKHAPCNNAKNGNAGKPACIIYRCQTLVGNGNGGQSQAQKELAEIQGKKYTCVRVYFGCRAKRKGTGASGSAGACPSSGSEGTCPPASTCKQGTCQAPGTSTCAASPSATTTACSHDVPLLLELHRNGASGDGGNGPDYYVHRRSTNGAQKNGNGDDKYYWVKLPCASDDKGATCSSGGKCTLKNLLDDIGLSTTKKSGAGHEKLQKLLKTAFNNNGEGSVGANGLDLCKKLQEANGSKLKNLLSQSVNGDSTSHNGQNTLITLLLQRIQFDLIDSLVILLDQRKCKNGEADGGQNGYGEGDISTAVSNLQPAGKKDRINRLKLGNGDGNGNGKPIKVTDATQDNGDTSPVCKCLAKCLTKYGYWLIQHDFEKAVTGLGQGCSAGLRLLIPTKDNNSGGGGGGGGGGSSNGQNKYQELKLYEGQDKTDPQYLQYLYYQNGGSNGGPGACTTADPETCSITAAQTCSKLYVVFYRGVGVSTGGTNGDPRPLLVCYGGCWYRPKTKDGYFDTWVKVTGVDKGTTCACLDVTADTTDCEKCEKIFAALTRVVGFLNRVELQVYPGQGGTTGGQTCQPGQQGTCSATATGPGTTCQAAATSGAPTATTCKYEVHQFMGKKVQVEVTCCPVSNGGGSTTSSCYKKLTHRPAGMDNGSGNGDGFRLGNIVYCPNGGSSGNPQGRIDYYNGTNGQDNGNNTSDHKWKPLVSVTVYYYNEDKGHCDPILVELTFAKVENAEAQNGVNGDKEYYRLDSRNGGKLVWEKDTKASTEMKTNPSAHLDSIRYCLKQVVKICLEKNKQGDSYSLEVRNANKGAANGFTKINGTPPSNGKIDVQECKCTGCDALATSGYKCFKHDLSTALRGKHRQVAGLAFTLPCQKGADGNGTCCVNGGTGAGTGFVEIPVCVVGQAGGDAECGAGAKTGCPPAPPGAATCPAPPGTCPAAPEPTAGTCSAAPGAPSVPCTAGQPITSLTYNSCMGDVYVYFYGEGGPQNGGGDTNTADTVPLMVRFNGQFYRPCDRDLYFTKWVCVPGLNGLCKTQGGCKCCCCCGTGSGSDCGPGGPGADCGQDCPCCSQLAEQLDKVNACLNRIDLDPEKARLVNGAGGGGLGAGKGYGLPEQCQPGIRGCTLDPSVGNNRVCLTKQEPKNGAQNAYTRVIHRTKNGFRIGCLTYCGVDFATHGVTPNAQEGQPCAPGTSGAAQTCTPGSPSPANGQNGTIRVANGTKTNGGHKSLVESCGWNTVVVYYSCSDQCMWLPQLIVVLKTDKVNSEPVTGSAGKKYGYYVLSSASGGQGGGGGSPYVYQWREVNGKSSSQGVTLNDKTDFQLLNSAVILVEQRQGKCSRGYYGESEIKKAVSTAGLKSPGNSDGVNRLTGKQITVAEEKCTGSGAGTHTCPCPCKCLNNTGFKVMTHDLDQLVKLNGQFKGKLSGVTLITGLKFVIPTAEKGKYKQVTLNGDGAQNGSVKYHQSTKDKVCVYFYCSDPRPLLVSYNGWAYRANSKDDYDGQKWTQCKDASKCDCTQPPAEKCDQCPLLKALVGVSDFLNPVNIKQVPDSESISRRFCHHYRVHRFNGKWIWIMVTSQPAIGSFCYHQYTHTHYGVGCGGSGFRLGHIQYNKECIKLNGTNSNGNNKCISASDVNNSDTTPKTYKSASHVVVFYYKGDKNHEHPLLVALKKLGEGASTGDIYSPYYELTKKFDTGQEKTYKKNGKEALDVSDTKPGGELAKKLDSILFNISKKLQIVLSKRPEPTEYSSDPDSANGPNSLDQKGLEEQLKKWRSEKAKLLNEVAAEVEKTAKTAEADPARKLADPEAFRSALMHHVTGSTTYEAKLCDSKPAAPPPPPTPNGTTQIKVTQVKCHKLYEKGGYRCFKHDLVNANNIESVGGLVLCLWVQKGVGGAGQGPDGKCKPCTEQGSKVTGKDGLELCENSTGGSNGKNGNKVDLHYNVCKGDLYVFFYGDYGSKVTLKRVLQNNFISFIYIHEYINIFNN